VKERKMDRDDTLEHRWWHEKRVVGGGKREGHHNLA
jgi:hypothetical protein